MLALAFAVGIAAATPVHPLVVIDAGHGGAKQGAHGICGIWEKNITLDIARQVGRLLRASGQATPLLTRKRDTDVDLEARPALANAAHAALFVSIHANASRDPASHGIETYFLSRHDADRRAEEIAERENEGRSTAPPADDDALGAILHGLRLDAAHVESQRLAMEIQRTLHDEVDPYGRGVLQAPFIVLRGANMAAVLVEVGFITNPTECKELATPAYRHKIARALVTAIIAHLDDEQALAQR